MQVGLGEGILVSVQDEASEVLDQQPHLLNMGQTALLESPASNKILKEHNR